MLPRLAAVFFPVESADNFVRFGGKCVAKKSYRPQFGLSFFFPLFFVCKNPIVLWYSYGFEDVRCGRKRKIYFFFWADAGAVQYILWCDKSTSWRVFLARLSPSRARFDNMLQHTAAHCNTLPHTAAQCNALQHAATHCSTLQRTATHCNTLPYTATHCNTLQHTALHCHTLQHIAIHCHTLQPLQHTATYCNILQHTATYCNALQHTARHCKTLWHTL